MGDEQVIRVGRGFAGMSRERLREISARGGKAAQEKGTAHRYTSDEARIAGRKGGKASATKRKAVAETQNWNRVRSANET